MSDDKTPNTDAEWTIHSLNIQGIFFQKLIASIIEKHKGVRLADYEYPVEFPKNSQWRKGKESRLDVWAIIRNRYRARVYLHLLIECKKANPDFVDWVFFQKVPAPTSSQVNFLTVSNSDDTEAGKPNYDYATRHLSKYAIVDEARETRGTYGNVAKSKRTKTSNAAITDAAYQVTLATHAIASEDYERALNRPTKIPFIANYYLPIIVTTANLYICEFDPAIVSISNGEVPFDRVDLRPVHGVFYEYPIPPHLQIRPDDWWLMDRREKIDKYTRRHILVVTSEYFEETLDWLVRSEDFIVDG